jgi:calcineurin-like phosphoesterase family protein
MPNTFFWSDTHFSHSNIIKFEDANGKRLREFDTIEDMDEHMIKQHNSVVKPSDTCWHGGDVVINRKALKLISRLNGRKRLVLGNHDIFKNKDYFNAGFEDLHAFRKFDGFALTHIPVHAESLGRWGINIHGHTHANRVMMKVREQGFISEYIDPRYYCICMEQLDDYTPISLEDLRKKINA